MKVKYAIVIPVHNNQDSIPQLIECLDKIAVKLKGNVQVFFVNDGSTDDSVSVILKSAQFSKLNIEVLHHSRNFGSFAAIRTGIGRTNSDYIGVISADLQEPPELLLAFFQKLTDGSADIVFGIRSTRNDPKITALMSNFYWKLYRKFINNSVPIGGVDVFAFNRLVSKTVNELSETNTSLIGMLFWVGFKREFVSYQREIRKFGKSSWTFRKKFKYMSDSVYSFSHLPIHIIQFIGAVGSIVSIFLGGLLLILSAMNKIQVPGYAPIMLTILLGNSSILIALGILGSYLWRTHENTQKRPFAITYIDGKED